MKKGVKFNPSPEQKLGAIEHIVYEYANLISAGHHSLKGAEPWRTNSNDAFLLGCRKMHDFLMTTKKNRQKDDVLALDYVDRKTRTWDVPIWRTKWLRHMDKYLPHISYSRLQPSPGWNHTVEVPRLLHEFKKAFWDFHDAIKDEGYLAEFKNWLDYRQQTEELGFKHLDLSRSERTIADIASKGMLRDG